MAKKVRKKYRLSLDKTWSECLRMWKWIAKTVRKSNDDIDVDIGTLKIVWLMKNGYKPTSIVSACFFCHYSTTHFRATTKNTHACCLNCPGVLVDDDFYCMTYPSFEDDPIEFYNLLKELNKRRLAQKAKNNKRRNK